MNKKENSKYYKNILRIFDQPSNLLPYRKEAFYIENDPREHKRSVNREAQISAWEASIL